MGVVPNNVVAPCGWYNDAIAVGHSTQLEKPRHQPSKQDVHGDVVNLPLSFGVEAIRFCLFGAGPKRLQQSAQVYYTITEYAKCVCLIEFVSLDRWLTERQVLGTLSLQLPTRRSLRSGL